MDYLDDVKMLSNKLLEQTDPTACKWGNNLLCLYKSTVDHKDLKMSKKVLNDYYLIDKDKTKLINDINSWIETRGGKYLELGFRNRVEYYLDEQNIIPTKLAALEMGIKFDILLDIFRYLIDAGIAPYHDIYPYHNEYFCSKELKSKFHTYFKDLRNTIFGNHLTYFCSIVSEYLKAKADRIDVLDYRADLSNFIQQCTTNAFIISKLNSPVRFTSSAGMDAISRQPLGLPHSLMINLGKSARFKPDKIGIDTYWYIKHALRINSIDKLVLLPPEKDDLNIKAYYRKTVNHV